MFVALLVAMAAPALLAFFLALGLNADCFLGSCTGSQPGAAAVAAGFGVLCTLVPFAGVRFYQGGRPASPALRVLALVGLVLVMSYPVRLVFGVTVFP